MIGRTFENPNKLPLLIVSARLNALDINAIVTFTYNFLFPGTVDKMQLIVVETSLTDLQVQNALSPAITIMEAESISRKVAAKPNAGKVSELKGISISQAKTWLVRKLHGSDTEATIDASIDAATTVADLKPILKNIIATSYKRTETDKTILALLISIADQIMPDR
jgi:hypothetical protein